MPKTTLTVSTLYKEYYKRSHETPLSTTGCEDIGADRKLGHCPKFASYSNLTTTHFACHNGYAAYHTIRILQKQANQTEKFLLCYINLSVVVHSNSGTAAMWLMLKTFFMSQL